MIDAITSAIGNFLYNIFGILFLLMDILQGLFRSIAGVGDIGYGGDLLGNGTQQITGANTGMETETGIVYYLLTSDLVKNLFLSIALLALFLMIVFMVMAFIKNTYVDKPKSWKDIVSNAIKGLANFIFIPVCCLLGVWLGNILLNAIDGATSLGGATDLSRKIFIASAYNSNKVRTGELFGEEIDVSEATKVQVLCDYVFGEGTISVTKPAPEEPSTDLDYYANIVDMCFSVGSSDVGKTDWSYKGSASKTWDNLIQTSKLRIKSYVPIFTYWQGGEIADAEAYVGCWYSTFDFNYILLIAGGIFMMYILINITYGMIKRLFVLLMLFIISPALCAMYPLDDGKAANGLKSDFIKNTISAYGAVAGMNLFFSLSPIIENINLATGTHVTDFLVNNIIHIILLISGLFVVGDFINMISGYIGAGNAFADGKSLRGNVQGIGKKVGTQAFKYGVALHDARKRGAMAAKTVKDSGGNKRQQAEARRQASWNTLRERVVDDTIASAIAKITGDTMTNIKKQRLAEEYKGRDDAEEILHGKYDVLDTQDKFNKGITQSSKALGAIKSSLREEFWNDYKRKMDQGALTTLGVDKVKGDKAEAALKLIDNATKHVGKSNAARKDVNAYFGAHTNAINSVLSSSKVKDQTEIARAISTGSQLNINAMSQQVKTMFSNDASLKTTLDEYIGKMSALRHAEDELKTFNATHLDAIEGNKGLNAFMEAELMRVRQESHKNSGFTTDDAAVQKFIDASETLAKSIEKIATDKKGEAIKHVGKEVDNQKQIGK